MLPTSVFSVSSIPNFIVTRPIAGVINNSYPSPQSSSHIDSALRTSEPRLTPTVGFLPPAGGFHVVYSYKLQGSTSIPSQNIRYLHGPLTHRTHQDHRRLGATPHFRDLRGMVLSVKLVYSELLSVTTPLRSPPHCISHCILPSLPTLE